MNPRPPATGRADGLVLNVGREPHSPPVFDPRPRKPRGRLREPVRRGAVDPGCFPSRKASLGPTAPRRGRRENPRYETCHRSTPVSSPNERNECRDARNKSGATVRIDGETINPAGVRFEARATAGPQPSPYPRRAGWAREEAFTRVRSALPPVLGGWAGHLSACEKANPPQWGSPLSAVVLNPVMPY